MLGSSLVAVLNTGNKSEAATGYFTLYGDGIGAFGILGDCLKARVFALARELGEAIPPGVLNRPPTAELRPDQSDEASLIPYAEGIWITVTTANGVSSNFDYFINQAKPVITSLGSSFAWYVPISSLPVGQGEFIQSFILRDRFCDNNEHRC